MKCNVKGACIYDNKLMKICRQRAVISMEIDYEYFRKEKHYKVFWGNLKKCSMKAHSSNFFHIYSVASEMIDNGKKTNERKAKTTKKVFFFKQVKS